MKGKQILLLFLALALPSIIFVFLKMFGKNHFDVEPLFTEQVPSMTRECGLPYKLPYQIPDSVFSRISDVTDSLVVVVFHATEHAPVGRVEEKYEKEPVGWKYLDPEKNSFRQRCIFMIEKPFDVALIDRNGKIRGQYNSADREEVDRLMTEIAILLKKY
jgi:hypothetical protein